MPHRPVVVAAIVPRCQPTGIVSSPVLAADLDRGANVRLKFVLAIPAIVALKFELKWLNVIPSPPSHASQLQGAPRGVRYLLPLRR